MTADSGHVLRIERAFAASAEEVFDAWTSPEVMRRWFHCAHDWETPVLGGGCGVLGGGPPPPAW